MSTVLYSQDVHFWLGSASYYPVKKKLATDTNAIHIQSVVSFPDHLILSHLMVLSELCGERSDVCCDVSCSVVLCLDALLMSC